MHAGLLRDVLTIVLGLLTGVMSAAFGVGGATISTPGIRVLGASAFVAVGTTLPSILPSAASGTARYVRDDLVDWRAVRWTAPVGVVFAVVGSLLSHAVPGNGHWLMVLTAVLLGLTAWRMGRRPPRHDEPADADAAAAGAAVVDGPAVGRGRAPVSSLLGVGVVAGTLSGLLGIGGGVVMVPGFSELAYLPLKEAIATSLVCVGLLAVPGTITHAFLHDIDWRFAFLLAAAVVPGARLGAAAAIRASDRRLRLVVAGFLGVVAFIYAVGELNALR